jgi:threonylcarbamoyladenosine tRNA methylthiotransferase MtaB
MRVHLTSLGCRLNEAELETWSRQFQQRGHQLSTHHQHADLVVVNTCAVTDEAVRKSRKLLRRVQRDNPAARLVVSGCYASLNPQESADLPGVDLLIDNRDKAELVQRVSHELDLPLMPVSATDPDANGLFQRGRQRAFIKVQDGCRYRCTYCIVTHARGEERSRAAGEIIEEINALQQQGVQEVVLAGVHLGGYGSDQGSQLSELITRVLADTDVPRIRLGSLEPWELADDFWSLFDNPRLMPHLHLPLQSGADSVLRRMSRRCRSDEFRQLIQRARAAQPAFNITTDIIVGFPGESPDEWQQTLDLCAQIGFGHIHIFAFSPRQGTKAASLPDPIDAETKRQRSLELHQLNQRCRQQLLERQVGRQATVLIEGDRADEQGRWWGYTANYLRIGVSTDEAEPLTNRILSTRITHACSDHLLGQRC